MSSNRYNRKELTTDLYQIKTVSVTLLATPAEHAVLRAVTDWYSNTLHAYWGDYVRSHSLPDFDAEILRAQKVKTAQCSYRWLQGMTDDIKGQLASRLTHLQNTVDNRTEKLPELEAKRAKAVLVYRSAIKPANSNFIQVKPKQSVGELKQDIEYLAAKIAKSKRVILEAQHQLTTQHPSVCFGGKKRLLALNNIFARHPNLTSDEVLELPEYQHAVTTYRFHRSKQFFIPGSSDEVCGNQTAQWRATELEDKRYSYNLTLRLPHGLRDVHGETVNLTTFKVPEKFQQELHGHLEQHQRVGSKKLTAKKRKELLASGELTPAQALDYDTLSPLSYRFIDKNKTTVVKDGQVLHHYQLQITYRKPVAPIKTTNYAGIIGIDTNVDGFALADVDAKGNLLHREWIPYDLTGKNSQQREEAISKACATGIAYAVAAGKDVVIEDLEFSRKKKDMQAGYNTGMNRMLSNFAYSQLRARLLRQAQQAGVRLHTVFAGYSSQTARLWWLAELKCSIHEAAAFVIARRGLNFKEKVRCNRQKCLVIATPMANKETVGWSVIPGNVIFSYLTKTSASLPKKATQDDGLLRELRKWYGGHGKKTCRPASALLTAKKVLSAGRNHAPPV